MRTKLLVQNEITNLIHNLTELNQDIHGFDEQTNRYILKKVMKLQKALLNVEDNANIAHNTQYETSLTQPNFPILPPVETTQNPLDNTICIEANATHTQTQCSICQDTFPPRYILRQIKSCKHMFCEDCLVKWLSENKRTCPVCRQTL